MDPLSHYLPLLKISNSQVRGTIPLPPALLFVEAILVCAVGYFSQSLIVFMLNGLQTAIHMEEKSCF
jgi:hypothetical protein